ncbi:Cbb3-type cytochrome oxidase, subunit 3 [Beggiatoa alba B18LD]|uniref:Cbb3-type cytochrome oxidase, subunit 3 n=1 Tax=Beggiatoa alba B18LD TaxID=395493 RepID=I3CBZ3_9GAMM|nr:CcoQ/FixQ family Cbb3-type cytochrome c oxidase assembly chaperone [Beggiatoa alba]EIJ41136.1 Cbb3-type cytochrome oxidase, subunit 3 [Beggiatoa alba B18LD]
MDHNYILGVVQSIWTVVVMIGFLSIVAWAYSRRRKEEFDDIARQLIEDDDSVVTTGVKEKQHV